MDKLILDPAGIGLEVTGRSGNEIIVRCPFHEDKTPSGEYNIDTGLFYCFSCKTAMDGHKLVDEIGGEKYPLDWRKYHRDTKFGKTLEWVDHIKNPLAIGNEYLAKRQVSEWQIREHGILASDEGVIFKIEDVTGSSVTGIQVRYFDKKPKYKIFGSKQPLWPMKHLPFAEEKVVVEGVFGALRGEGTSSFKPFAMMGSGNVNEVAQILKFTTKNYMRNVVAIMDPDYAGLLAAGRFILHNIQVIIDETPPDEWPKEKWSRLPEMERTLDVWDVVNASDQPKRIENQLEKYWRNYIR